MVACGSLARTPEPPQAGWEPIAYSYGSARPHAVTAAGANTYEYDANGNTLAPGASAGVTCRVEAGVTYVQSYNAENRLSVVKKLLEGTCAAPVKFDMQWDFAYDGDGTRVKQVISTFDPDTQAITGMSVTSYFMAGLYEETDGVAGKYYAISGMTIAMSDAEGMKYLITDHLGSVAAITDDEGTLLDQQRYLPFGAERPNVGSIAQTDYGYTGQRDLAGMGLMDYKARAYDPLLMRFIQPDTLIPNPADPQAWNRFAYVSNSPIMFVDPTGHWEDEGCGSGKLCELLPAPHGSKLGEERAEDLFEVGAPTLPPDYTGPLPEHITNRLIWLGADPSLVQGVTISFEGGGKCGTNAAACTWYQTIYFPGAEYYDQSLPNEYLVHELVHARQFRDGGKRFEVDYSVRRGIADFLGQDIYTVIPAEAEGRKCQDAFQKNRWLSLDGGLCTLR